jgi:hypothetical protein
VLNCTAFASVDRYTSFMKDTPLDAIPAHAAAARGLERIVLLEAELARAPLIGRQHRELTKAIEIAAAAYRMSLDHEQANAAYDPDPLTGRATIVRSPGRRLRRSKRSLS